MPPPLHVSFIAGRTGTWRIDSMSTVRGEPLALAERLMIVEGQEATPHSDMQWALRGVTSNTRYTHKTELEHLVDKQEGLRRLQATCAAFIPIRKTAAWWDLAQDERRAIFEEQSGHIRIGMDYLPAIARRLHHSRELGEAFDFLTWFEYAPEHAEAFDDMLRKLRNIAEWQYIDREIDIRLSRSA
jgi:chlorite dismutase